MNTNWLNRREWQEGWPNRAKAAAEVLNSSFGELGSVLDLGCGMSLIKEYLQCESYTGIDLLLTHETQSDFMDINTFDGFDVIMGLGILEYIDVPILLKRIRDSARVLFFSYEPKEITPRKKRFGWINNYSIKQMAMLMEGTWVVKKNNYFFYRRNK